VGLADGVIVMIEVPGGVTIHGKTEAALGNGRVLLIASY
jgi:hypothetical protein